MKRASVGIGLSAIMLAAPGVQGASLGDIIEIGSNVPNLGDIENPPNSDQTEGTITNDDGTQTVIKTTDGSSIENVGDTNASELNIDGNRVSVSTDAANFRQAYDNPSQPETFRVTGVVDSRPVTIETTASPDSVDSESTFTGKVNGEDVTIELPQGQTLADFDGDTDIKVRDSSGQVILDGSLNSVSSDEVNRIASDLGVLNSDLALRGAQKQFMAQGLQLVGQRLNNATRDGLGGQVSASGLNAWASAAVSSVSGSPGNVEYDGSASGFTAGIDQQRGNLLGGVALGYHQVDVDSDTGNNGGADLSGNYIAPYAAVGVADDLIVFDGTLVYQDLDGGFSNDDFGVDVDGSRIGARGAVTYNIPQTSPMQVGVTAGGAYLNDDLDGTLLGEKSEYGAELGEVFAGVRVSNPYESGRLFGSAIYHNDVTSDVDGAAEVLDGFEDDRLAVSAGISQSIDGVATVNVTADTTIGSSSTEYTGLQAELVVPF